jgi:hypothetical protein
MVVVAGAAVVSVYALASAFAAGADNIQLSKDIVPAPFGYEPVSGSFVIAETTPLYISPYIYPGARLRLDAGRARRCRHRLHPVGAPGAGENERALNPKARTR